MGGSYKIEVMNTFFNKIIKDFHKLFFADFLAECGMADFIILAIDTTEIASRKENRS